MTQLKEYTWEQVQQHKSNKDCWLVINNQVIDCTKFLDEHPGGEEVLLEQMGQDATEAFDEIGHSDEAKGMLTKMAVGRVQGKKVTNEKVVTPAPPKTVNEGGSFMYSIFPVVVVVAWIVYKIYTK